MAATPTLPGANAIGRRRGPAGFLGDCRVTRRTTILTTRGRAVAAVAAVALCSAWLTGHVHVRLAAALLMAPLLVDFLAKGRAMPRLAVSVPPRRTRAGSPFLERLTLQNLERRRTALDVHVTEPAMSTLAGALLVETLPPGDRLEGTLPCRARRRGIHSERRFVLASAYPLGLLRREVEVVVPAELIVEPARVSLSPECAARASRAAETTSAADPGRSEFHSLRDYRYGEDARLVHARKSATTGVLVRKVLREPENRAVVVVVDLRRPPGGRPGHGRRRLEWSLGAAARLVDDAVERRARLTFLLIDAAGENCRRVEDETTAAEVLEALAGARTCRHRELAEDALTAAEDAEACFWVPAGGFSARADRRCIGDPVLVAEGSEGSGP